MFTKLGLWPQQCVLAFGAGCESLAEQIRLQWRGQPAPLFLPSQAGAELDRHVAELDPTQAWGLILAPDPDDPSALAANKALLRQGLPTLLLLDSPAGLWALRRLHPGIAPCLACLQNQAELLPTRQLRGAVNPGLDAAAKAALVLADLGSGVDSPLTDWTLYPLLPAQAGGACLALKDPLCPHCSAYAGRPNQVYFHQESQHD